MKHNRNIVLIIIALIINSCQLESELYDVISAESFPKTEEDVKAAVTAVYNTFKSDVGILSCAGWDGALIPAEMSTDIGQCAWGDTFWGQVLYQNWWPEPVGVAAITAQCFWYYSRISAATLTLYRIEQVNMDANRKARYIAEVKACRAWLAYILFDLYGPIPIATLEQLLANDDQLIIPRPTEEFMVKFIEDGMSEAIPELPYRYDKADYGRITKGLCQMILLKLYMKQHEWTKAIEIARELMKPEYGYRLYPRSSGGYPALFTLAAEQDNEIIYAVPNSTAFPNAWYPHVVAPTYPLNNEAIQKWGGYKMTWEFYWTFERGDERTTRLIAEYTGKDGLPYNEKLRGTITDLKLGVLPIKYEEDPASTGTDNQIDWIVYRYADVLLLLAEALNRANGGPTDEAFDLLNQVRRRAGLQDAVPSANFTVTTVKGTTLRPVTLSYDLTTMEGFNEFILAERGHELWFEGCRRQDLIRHGKYYEVIQKKNGYREGMSSEGRQYYPIPSWIILEGKGIILQNDPYK